jgi:filamentous hemagglutinin family protein
MKRGLWLLGYFQSGFVGILAWLVLSVFACKAFAQSSPSNIVPDSTLGVESSQVISDYEGLSAEAITGGATRGINLFHSFQEFNVSEGREAYFLSPNSSIQNILSRVTGSNKSEILGRLGTFGESEPNLFLINPNGIVFGKDASLDVRGSFVATTANALQFGLQGFFSATNPQPPSQLLRVNPSAFLFNQINQNAAIENNSVAPAGQDSAGFDAFGLRVADGKSLLLLGGNVLMDGGKLNAYGGRVELGGVTEAGNINLAVNGASLSLKFPDAVARADVFLANQAGVLVNGLNGGDIAVNARNLEISGESGLFAGIRFGLGTPNSKGGNIDINVTEAVDLTENSFIYNTLQRTATGKAGDININAGSVNLESGSVLSVSTYGKGDAGNIFMTASDGVSLKGRDTEIFNDVEPGAVGNGGETNIKASSLTLSERSQIEASVVSGNRNQPAGRGNAGNVNIDVRGTVSLIGVSDEPSDSNNTAIFNTLGNGSVGAGGNITIKANSVLLRDGGQLGVSTFGKGDAGDISIQALNGVFLDNAYISSLVGRGGVGNGGNIFINSGTLTLNNGALLQTSVRNAFNNQLAGRGNAGNIKVDVRDAVTISDAGSGIFSTVENRAIGNGGDINIKTGSLFVNNDGELNASSFGEGDAGNIFIEGRDRISFNNGFAISAIGTNALGSGGDINIKTGSLFVSNGAELTASSFGKGDVGSIIINANENVLFDDAAAYSSLESGAMGNGSNISIKAGTLTLNNGAQLQTLVGEASDTEPAGRGNAGQINIDVRDAVTISDAGSGILSTVENRAIGNGGDINIKAGSLFVNNDGELNASSFGEGNAGNIFIEGREQISFNNGFATSGIGTNALGSGGDINIKTGSLLVSNGAELTASSLGKGDAGSIIINANENVLFDNAAAYSSLEPGAMGNGSNISIKAGTLTLNNGAQLQTLVGEASDTEPAGRGNAGQINIDVRDAVTISDFGSGLSSLVGDGVIGNGGDINIKAGSLFVNNGAEIIASSYGQGNAGNVTVRAKDVVFLSGSRSNIFSTVQATGVGTGGNIDINAASVSLQDNASLLASTYGQGSAGNVTINTKDSILLDKANIYSTVERGGVGNGGNISVRAREIIINKGSLQTLVRGNYDNQPAGRGNAGQIDIDVRDAVNISGTDSGLFSVAQDGVIGNGGSINIKTGSLVASDGAEIIASIFGKEQTIQPAILQPVQNKVFKL